MAERGLGGEEGEGGEEEVEEEGKREWPRGRRGAA